MQTGIATMTQTSQHVTTIQRLPALELHSDPATTTKSAAAPLNPHNVTLEETLWVTTSAWLRQMDGFRVNDVGAKVTFLLDPLRSDIMKHMERKARVAGLGDEQPEAATSGRRQQDFFWDDDVAQEVRRFIQQPPDGVDACVLWCMMSDAVRLMPNANCHDDGSDDEGISMPFSPPPSHQFFPALQSRDSRYSQSSGRPLVTSRDAYYMLSKALISVHPMLAFNRLPAGFLKKHCQKAKEHQTNKVKRTPAFSHAMDKGETELMEFMINECRKFIIMDGTKKTADRYPLLRGISNPTEYLVRVMKESNPQSTVLQRAVSNYIQNRNQKQLEVIEILLKLDVHDDVTVDYLADEMILSQVVQQTFMAIRMVDDRRSVFPEDDMMCDDWQSDRGSNANDNHVLPVVEMMLQYRGDLKTKDAILGVLNYKSSWANSKFPGRDRNFRLNAEKEMERTRAQLVEIFTTDAELIVDEEVLQLIMEHDLVFVWLLAPIQRAVERLMADGQTAKALFHTALKLDKDLCFLQNIAGAPQFHRILDFELMSEIVKCGHLDIWKLSSVQARWKEINEKEHDRCMLHIAVQHQKVELVKQLLEEDPNSVMKAVPVKGIADLDVYPLWHLNFVVVDGKAHRRASTSPGIETSIPTISIDTASVDSAIELRSQSPKFPSKSSGASPGTAPNPDNKPKAKAEVDPGAEIRKLLVHATIEHADGMKTIAKIFRESDESVGQVCFDLSRFASRLYSVDEFVQSLKALSVEETKHHLKFEEVLRYADFPALDLDVWEKGPERCVHVHGEVFETLRWLKRKGVRKVMKLKVLDRMYNPHDEEKIGEEVEELGVLSLDWRHLDIAISCFKPKTKKRLTELHLYSSGKMAVVDHWLSADGIKSLEKLKSVKIHFIQDLMTPECCTRLKAKIAPVLRELKGCRKGFQYTMVVQMWNSLPPNNTKNLSEIAERAVPDLFAYITRYSSWVSESLNTGKQVRPTRIAILDNGILNIPPRRGSQNHKGLWPRIEDGHSFVDDASRLGSWLFASDPHGTQMANLICAIDPHCELYVAKVVEGRQGILPDNVAEAINWAISRDVDIISMSFSIPDFTNNNQYSNMLQKAVMEADQKGIIQYCSHHDEGWNVKDSWPASCHETKVIVACNEFGNFSDRHVGQYDYKVHGTDISAGAVPYLESNDSISGSSVATAIVAGVSSLMLSCRRMQFPEETFGANGVEYHSKKRFVEAMLKNISDQGDESDPNSQRYIRLRKFSNFLQDKDSEEVYPWLN